MAGRKRKTGPRHPSGQLKRTGPDRGAPRARAARDYLAQGARPELTAYPLGVMCAVGDISEGERQAGCRYAWLHSVRYGKVTLSALAWDGAPSPGPRALSDGARSAIEEELRAADAALHDAGGAPLRALIETLTVHERTPRWMTPRAPLAADVRAAAAARRGLETLARLWNYRIGHA